MPTGAGNWQRSVYHVDSVTSIILERGAKPGSQRETNACDSIRRQTGQPVQERGSENEALWVMRSYLEDV